MCGAAGRSPSCWSNRTPSQRLVAATVSLAAFALAAVVVAVTLGTIGQIKAHVKFRSKHGWKIETNETGVSGNPLPKPKAEPKTKPAKAAKPKPAPKTGKATGRKVTKKHENGRQTVTEPVTEPAPAPDPAAA